MEAHIWKIEWNDRLSIGIPEIDVDHKRFISLVNEFNRSIAGRMDLSEIKKRLQPILDDAVQHFAHEERLFKQWNYPDVEDHERKHAEIIATLQTIIKQLNGYELMPQWIEAGLAIKDVLITHILTEDMKYAEFYRNSPELHQQQLRHGPW
ncbi:MAG: bacteriohemerythrin [Methylocella sp.]